MDEEESHVFLDPESVPASVGDQFVGVPVSRSVVEAVAARYDVEVASLARAVREAGKASPLTAETLFSGYDPLPLGRDDDGLLYVRAEADGCWDAAADRVGLTEVGRDAVATAHELEVKEMSRGSEAGHGSGFVLRCSEFPVGAVNDVVAVVERTRLTNRQATVWILSQYVPSRAAIARILSISEAIVESELAAVDRVTRESAVETRTLDAPGPLTRLEPEPQSSTWMGIEWSKWFDLRDSRTLREELPRRPGLYRVRHSRLPGLMYVGESGAEGGVRQRVGLELAGGMDGSDGKAGQRHGAARPLRQITEVASGMIEVSVATPPISANRSHRRAIEATLVAVCRREAGFTPMVQLNRAPAAQLVPTDGGLNRELTSIAERASYTAPPWRPWRDVTATQWLGLDWTEGRPLSERDAIDSTGVHAFRLFPDDRVRSPWDGRLHEIGTTGSIESRLFGLRNQYGDDLQFSVVALDGLSPDTRQRSRELAEVRYDLIGAYYLATGAPPDSQP